MFIEVPLADGETILVEAGPDEAGVIRARRGDGLVAASAETFEQSLSKVRRMAESILKQFSDLGESPGRIRAEFGITVSAEAGMVVAKGTGEAHFVLELEWTRPGAADGK